MTTEKLGDHLMVIYGPPGTGKTTRVLELLESELEQGTQPDQIAFATFTCAARDEARDRAQAKFDLSPEELKWFKTLHATGYNLLGMNDSRMLHAKLEREFCERFFYELTLDKSDKDDDQIGAPPLKTLDDDLRATYEWGRQRQMTPREAWSKGPHRVDIEALELYVRRYHDFKREKEVFDFGDMLEEGIKQDPPPCRVAIIDEAQDLTPLQISACYAWYGQCERVYVAGDDDQCQPDGTMVRLADGSTLDIADLDPSKHQLQSYSRSDAAVYGSTRRSYSFCKRTRPYRGPMIGVHSAGLSTHCTPDHQWLTRFTARAKQARWTIVYLMRRGTSWRVGWCQLFRSDGVFHPGHRARMEKAESLWILKVFSSKAEASIEESFISSTYGIPTMLLEPTRGATHYTRPRLDDFWSRMGDLTVKAAACLNAHGLLIRRPIWNNEVAQSKKAGAQIFKTAAANLLPGLMTLPYPEGRRVAWSEFEITRRPFSGDVHSLDVEKYHTYIADGLVTCNSIYMWAGADPAWMIALQKVATHYEMLEQSYRVPSAVQQVANAIIHRNKRRVDKPYRSAKLGGNVVCTTQRKAIQAIIDYAEDPRWTTFVLVRNRMFAARFAKELMRQGVPFLSDIGSPGPLGKRKLCGAVLAADRFLKHGEINGTDLRKILDFVPSGKYAPRGVKTKVRGDKSDRITRMQLILDYNLGALLERFAELGPALALFKERTDTLQYLDLVLKRLGDLPVCPNVNIMTMHASKGREANTVIVVSDMAKASWLEWQRDAEGENRVAYVAVTRAKDELLICDPETPRHYPYWEFVKHEKLEEVPF